MSFKNFILFFHPRKLYHFVRIFNLVNMKYYNSFILTLNLILFLTLDFVSGKSSTFDQSIYNIEVKSSSGKSFRMKRFSGKKILIVNVASNCGYTPQYKDLQNLYDEFSNILEIIAVPCNDFGGQEPSNNEGIKEFCRVNYGVTFSILEKIKIKGQSSHPLYRWLTDPSKNGWNSKFPSWNFCKYLIDEKGNLIEYFPSGINPKSNKIISKLL